MELPQVSTDLTSSQWNYHEYLQTLPPVNGITPNIYRPYLQSMELPQVSTDLTSSQWNYPKYLQTLPPVNGITPSVGLHRDKTSNSSSSPVRQNQSSYLEVQSLISL